MIGRRGHVGWEVRCDAVGCTATTATAAPPAFRRTADRALEAAKQLGWMQARVGGQPRWVCPMHQVWEPRLDRWVVRPLSVRP